MLLGAEVACTELFESLGGFEQGVRDLLTNLYDRIDERCRHGAGSSFQEYLDRLNFDL